MDKVRDFKDLVIWQKGIEIAMSIYSLTDTFPKTEQFGLTNQLRRAGISVPSNIAEGHIRDSDKDFARFLGFSLGSLAELETQIIIAEKLGYVSDDAKKSLIQQIRTEIRQIRSLKNVLISNTDTQS